MTARVDIALPYYGDVAMMKEAVRSVLSQQFTDWRLLVIDDGYPDPEPARFFAAIDDERVSYRRNEQNLGANENYRRCLDLVTAPIMMMMGADDVMLANHLQVVVDAFDAVPGAAVVQTGVQVIDQFGRPVRPLGDRIKSVTKPTVQQRTSLSGESLAISLLRANWTYFPALAWRSDGIKAIGFRPGLHVTQDLALLLDTVRAGGELVLDPVLSFLYRRHLGSDSSVKALDGRRFAEERALFDQEARSFAGLGWTRAARAARGHLTSRLNALSLIPSAFGKVGPSAATTLGRHVVG